MNYLVGVMQGKRISRQGKYVYPSPHTRTLAACKILDIAEMPAKRNAIDGSPVQVNISIGGAVSGPVTIEGGA